MPSENPRANSDIFLGGSIAHLISNQYEKDFLDHAIKIDQSKQEIVRRHKEKLAGLQSSTGPYCETIANRKRMEANAKKLKIINVNE